jgi:hypothetical protein
MFGAVRFVLLGVDEPWKRFDSVRPNADVLLLSV